jgi:hypothetical protein
MWLKKLQWKHMDEFYSALREPLYAPSDPSGLKTTGAFRKQYNNLAMYYIMRAGHMARPPLPPPYYTPESFLSNVVPSVCREEPCHLTWRVATNYYSGPIGPAGSSDRDAKRYPWNMMGVERSGYRLLRLEKTM